MTSQLSSEPNSTPYDQTYKCVLKAYGSTPYLIIVAIATIGFSVLIASLNSKQGTDDFWSTLFLSCIVLFALIRLQGERAMATEALLQARNIVRQLSTQEKLYLLNDITAQLVQASAVVGTPIHPAFPVFHIAEWPVDIPTRREDLYNDRGPKERCEKHWLK